tara:strand:- start:76 stop:843 length:768 start_codon:yes stop_codon:yes gene_type:complete
MIGFLIDMDGVIYRGGDLIPGADEFINQLIVKNIPFRFMTNNSQRTRLDVVAKLGKLGIYVEEKHIFTCAMATARYLAGQDTKATAFVIGEGGLLTALHKSGIAIDDQSPDYVVIGEGRTFNLEQVEKAVEFVTRGAKLISTNPDLSCPTSTGIRPGCGAMAAMIEATTGRKAFSLGKPNPIMMRMVRKDLELSTKETVVIGDMMDTDIFGAVQLEYHSVLVLSGGTKKSDLSNFSFQPAEVHESLAAYGRHAGI